jgi:hypothetical protein
MMLKPSAISRASDKLAATHPSFWTKPSVDFSPVDILDAACCRSAKRARP